MPDIMQALYDEFGREHVGIVRRELTMRHGAIPSYIELLAELCLRQGWRTPPLDGAPLSGSQGAADDAPCD